MIISTSSKPLAIISYNTTTYRDLVNDLRLEGHTCERIDPVLFLESPDSSKQYINLVNNIMSERRVINDFLDTHNLDRFTYMHPTAVCLGTVEPGCLITPMCYFYYGTVVKKDCIIHSQCVIGHEAIIGQGTYMSSSIVIGGSTNIGKYCKIMMGVLVHDKLNICDEVTLASQSLVRKDIVKKGTYYTPKPDLVELVLDEKETK